MVVAAWDEQLGALAADTALLATYRLPPEQAALLVGQIAAAARRTDLRGRIAGTLREFAGFHGRASAGNGKFVLVAEDPQQLLVGTQQVGLVARSEAGPPPISAMRLPLNCSGRFGKRSRMSSLLSAATRFRRQIATGSFSTRTRRQAGSHGRSQVRPRMPGKTFEYQLTINASV